MSEPNGAGPSNEAASLAAWLDSQGAVEAADRARQLVSAMTDWEQGLRTRAGEALGVHHDIRNALTGVLGNAQLLLMGPAADLPGVRRRLDSLVHEAERIKEMAERLQRARMELAADGRPAVETRAEAQKEVP